MNLICCLLTGIITLTSGAIDGLEIKKQKEWPGESLYGFMNGGSELFLEYGFETMIEQEVVYEGNTFQMEYYVMESEQDAYGIYSVHCFKCRRTDSLTLAECTIPTYLQLQQGRLYLTIVAQNRTPTAQKALDVLANAVLRANPLEADSESSTPTGTAASAGQLTPAERVSGRDFFMRGPLGLSSAYSSWEHFFYDFPNFTMWMQCRSDNSYSAQVTFESAQECDAFCAQEDLKAPDAHVTVTRTKPQSIILEEVPLQ